MNALADVSHIFIHWHHSSRVIRLVQLVPIFNIDGRCSLRTVESETNAIAWCSGRYPSDGVPVGIVYRYRHVHRSKLAGRMLTNNSRVVWKRGIGRFYSGTPLYRFSREHSSANANRLDTTFGICKKMDVYIDVPRTGILLAPAVGSRT